MSPRAPLVLSPYQGSVSRGVFGEYSPELGREAVAATKATAAPCRGSGNMWECTADWSVGRDRGVRGLAKGTLGRLDSRRRLGVQVHLLDVWDK